MTKHKPKRESDEADGCSTMFAGPEAASRHTATHPRHQVAPQLPTSQPAATPTVHMRLPVYGSRQAKMEQGIGMKSHIQPRRRHVDSIAFGEKATRYPIKIHFQDQSKHFPITKIISKHHPRPIKTSAISYTHMLPFPSPAHPRSYNFHPSRHPSLSFFQRCPSRWSIAAAGNAWFMTCCCVVPPPRFSPKTSPPTIPNRATIGYVEYACLRPAT